MLREARREKRSRLLAERQRRRERLEDDGFERRDYSLESWAEQGPPDDVFSYWKASVPDPEARRGILVEDAIVVVENVHRHIEMGKSRYQAAIDGARSAWALLGHVESSPVPARGKP